MTEKKEVKIIMRQCTKIVFCIKLNENSCRIEKSLERGSFWCNAAFLSQAAFFSYR
jgi:hypothetical protein